METTSVGSVFILIFLSYCALVVVSHLIEYLRLRVTRSAAPTIKPLTHEGGSEKAV